jgi:hypothetical protein
MSHHHSGSDFGFPHGDTCLDAFVDALATASHHSTNWRSARPTFADVASLPPDFEIAPEWHVYIASIMRPAAQERIKKLLDQGFHQPGDVEQRFGFTSGNSGVRRLKERSIQSESKRRVKNVQRKQKPSAFVNWHSEELPAGAAS